MAVVLKYAPNEDRQALLDILFIPEVKVTLDLLPTDTNASLLERIGDNAFYQIEVDEMLYGFIAIIDNDSIVFGVLPDGGNTDYLPLVCCVNVVLDKHINAELNQYGLFFTKQEPLLMGHLPTLKHYGSRKFYPNPLLVGVNDHTAIKDYRK